MTETKPIIRGIKRPNTLKSKIDILLRVMFETLPEAELKTLTAIIEYSTNGAIAITADIGRQIRDAGGITESSFSTSLYRLEKKGIIKRSGKTVFLNPVFVGIGELDKFVVSFEA